MIKRALSLLAVFVVGLACAGLALSIVSAPAYAAKSVRDTPEPKRATKPKGLSDPVYKLLKAGDDLEKAGDLNGALAKAKQAQALPEKTPQDDYTINAKLATIYLKLQDYANAGAAYEAAWLSGLAPPEEKGLYLNALAQIFFANKDYTKALAYADQHFKEVGDNLDLQGIVANIYYIQKDNTKAFATAQDLMTKAKAQGIPPKEAWLQLYLYTGNAMKNDAAVKEALFGLIEGYPNKDYWHNIAAHFYFAKGRTDHYGLMALRLMKAADAMTESKDYLATAQLALNVGLGGEAKKAIEAGEAAGLLPGNDRTITNDFKALAAAASKGEPGNLDAKDAQAAAGLSGGSDVAIGEAFAVYGMYDKAIAAINRGIAKPTLRNPDEARVALGWVHFLAGQPDQARTAFESVKTEAKSMDLARAWLALLRSKTVASAAPPAGTK